MICLLLAIDQKTRDGALNSDYSRLAGRSVDSSSISRHAGSDSLRTLSCSHQTRQRFFVQRPDSQGRGVGYRSSGTDICFHPAEVYSPSTFNIVMFDFWGILLTNDLIQCPKQHFVVRNQRCLHPPRLREVVQERLHFPSRRFLRLARVQDV